jgi:anthranilate synthase component 2
MQNKVLLIDNYDSFTYNLLHYLEDLEAEVTCVRNDLLSDIRLQDFQKILISPGSGLPHEAGQLMSFLQKNHATLPILGICLGQQALAQLFNAQLAPLAQVKHGESTMIKHLSNDYLYEKIPQNFEVGQYFSWYIKGLPHELEITSITTNGIPMSIKHKEYDVRAVQYHPESIMTPHGKQILENWLKH